MAWGFVYGFLLKLYRMISIFISQYKTMKSFRYFAQRYVDWVIRLGRVRFSLLGIAILAILAICIQILLSTLLSDGIHWSDIARSITFGLFTAPFVIYFYTTC